MVRSSQPKPAPLDTRPINVKTLATIALLFTLVLLLSILVIAQLLDTTRKDYVSDEIQQTYNSLNEMQTFLLLSEAYGSDMACIAFEEKLEALDASLWELGQKLDQYRSASEEIRKDPFYINQKKTFNEQQIVYMLLLRTLREECNYPQVLIAYFYQNSADCPRCDDQSFVLTDVNREFDQRIAIFSYDLDLNLTTVNLLSRYYKLDNYPCIVIDDVSYCGIQDKNFVVGKVCESAADYPACIAWLNDR